MKARRRGSGAGRTWGTTQRQPERCPMSQTACCQTSQASALVKKTLAAKEIETLGRETGFVRRRRLVTAASVFWALMVTLGAQRMEYISDVLRTLNAREGWSLRYKPFWNRLAKVA